MDRFKHSWPYLRPVATILASAFALLLLKLTADFLERAHYLDGANRLFGAQRYTALEYCLNSDPTLLWMYWTVNNVTFFSDTILGLGLLLNRSKIERFIRFVYYHPPAVLLFGATFLSNGLNHLTETLTLTTAIYYLDVIMNTVTAAVSLTTAVFVLWSFYGPHTLPQVNEGEDARAGANPRIAKHNR